MLHINLSTPRSIQEIGGLGVGACQFNPVLPPVPSPPAAPPAPGGQTGIPPPPHRTHGVSGHAHPPVGLVSGSGSRYWHPPGPVHSKLRLSC